jgi:hypothetical protein
MFESRGHDIVVDVYDVLGNHVRRTDLDTAPPGSQDMDLDCSDLPRGVCTVRVNGVAGGTTHARLTVSR